jgi:predicted nucleotide-binding protein
MMPWSEAVDLTGESQPHTYDVVHAGITHAAATIVIFSPDDLGRAKDEFSAPGDPERNPSGQARQNVLLEAGMAFAMARDRTIFVKSARTRDISDIAGFNWVKLDGSWDSRKDLKGRLAKLSKAVRSGDYDLRDALAGPFRID